jgi:16S rRNA processing protein RimM
MADASASTSPRLIAEVATKPQRPPRTQLRVCRLTKAHGLKGGIRVEMYTDDPAKRFVPGATFALQVPTESAWHGKRLELVELRWLNANPVAFFVGVDDRTAAEGLLKAILWIDQDPDEPAEDDAWYDHEIVGFDVVRDGVRVGTLAKVEHRPAQDLLIVDTAGGEVYVPFVKAIVTAVDLETRTITVDPPGGLFEELPAADDAPEGAPAEPAAEPDGV